MSASQSAKILSLTKTFLDSASSEFENKKYDKAHQCCLMVLKQSDVSTEQTAKTHKLLLFIAEEFFKHGQFLKAEEVVKPIQEQKIVEDMVVYIAANIIAGKARYGEYCKSKKEEDRSLSDKYFSKALVSSNTASTQEYIQEWKDILSFQFAYVVKMKTIDKVTPEAAHMHAVNIIKANRLAIRSEYKDAEKVKLVLQHYNEALKYFKKNPLAWAHSGHNAFLLSQFQSDDAVRIKMCETAIEYIDAAEKLSKKGYPFGEDSYVMPGQIYFVRGRAYDVLRKEREEIEAFRRGFLSSTSDKADDCYTGYTNISIVPLYLRAQEILISQDPEISKVDDEKSLAELNKINADLRLSPYCSELIHARSVLLDKLKMHEFAINDIDLAMWLIKNNHDATHHFTSTFELELQLSLYRFGRVLKAIADGNYLESVMHYQTFITHILCLITSFRVDQKALAISQFFRFKTDAKEEQNKVALIEKAEKLIDKLSLVLSEWKLDEAEKQIRKIISAFSNSYPQVYFERMVIILNNFYFKVLLTAGRKNEKKNAAVLIETLERTLQSLELDAGTSSWVRMELKRLKHVSQIKEKNKEEVKSQPVEVVDQMPSESEDEITVPAKKKSAHQIKKQQRKKEKKKQKELGLVSQTVSTVVPAPKKAKPKIKSKPTQKIEELKKEIKVDTTKIPGVKIKHDEKVQAVYQRFEAKGIKRVYTLGGYACEKLKPTGKQTDCDFIFGSAEAKADPQKSIKSIFPDAISIKALDELEALTTGEHKEEKSTEDKVFIVELLSSEKYDVILSDALSDESKADEEARAAAGKKLDFTANGIFINSAGKAFDTTGRGYQHLKDEVLRSPTEMKSTFEKYPLRVFRAINFYHKRDWHVTDNMWDVIKKLDPRVIQEKLIKNSGRTNSWMMKLLSYGYGVKNFNKMFENNLIEKLFPEFNAILKSNDAVRQAVLRELAAVDESAKKNIRTDISIIYQNWVSLMTEATKPKQPVIDTLFSATFAYCDAKNPKSLLRLEQPEKVNSILEKLLINGEAVKNFQSLIDLGVIGKHFPELNNFFGAFKQYNLPFFLEQLKLADDQAEMGLSKPEFNRIYATWVIFIAKKTRDDSKRNNFKAVIESNPFFNKQLSDFDNIEKEPFFENALRAYEKFFPATPIRIPARPSTTTPPYAGSGLGLWPPAAAYVLPPAASQLQVERKSFEKS